MQTVTTTGILNDIANAKNKAFMEGREPTRVYLGEWQRMALSAYVERHAMVTDPKLLGQPETVMGLEVIPVLRDDHLTVA
jgi:hypothetical protein